MALQLCISQSWCIPRHSEITHTGIQDNQNNVLRYLRKQDWCKAVQNDKNIKALLPTDVHYKYN